MVLVEVDRRLGDLISKVKEDGSMRSPIRSLPIELVTKIFMYCLPENSSSDHDIDPYVHGDKWIPIFPRPLMLEAPILLCQICHSWRQIALFTPTLWSGVLLDSSKSRSGLIRKLMMRRASGLEYWLQIPDSQSISVMLQHLYIPENMVDVSNVLITNMSRLKEIYIVDVTMSISTIQSLLDSISSGAPSLETLWISHSKFSSWSLDNPPIRFRLDFSSHPRLSKLSICSEFLDINSLVTSPQNDIHIRITGASLAMIAFIMATLPSLHTLESFPRDDSQVSFRGDFPITVPRMELPLSSPIVSRIQFLILALHLLHEDILEFFESMELPSLLSLRVMHAPKGAIFGESRSIFTVISDFLIRSKCNLKSLMIEEQQTILTHYGNTSNAEASSLLKATPNLQYFAILALSDTSKAFLRSLIDMHNMHDAIWPELKTMKIEIRLLPHTLLKEIVISRRANIARRLTEEPSESGNTAQGSKEHVKTNFVLSSIPRDTLVRHPAYRKILRQQDVRFLRHWDDDASPQTLDEYENDI